MSTFALEISNVTKKYKTDFWKKPTLSVDDVSFQVPQKSICGLIGPNGAGKTTVLKMILGFIEPTAGHVKIFDKSASDKNTHNTIGYLPESAYYYDYLKPVEFLDFYAKLFNIPADIRKERIKSLLDLVGLTGREDTKLRGFSKGMLQRIGIAQALINDPELVIFDEPMSGLDPVGRKDVRDIMLALKEKGKTVLFSTHILSDVENLCDHAVMLIKGKLKASGNVTDLVQPRVRSYDLVIDSGGDIEVPSDWKSNVRVMDFQNNKTIRFQQTDSINQKTILDWVQKNNISMVSFVPHKESLEDILIQNME
jgi:ABC-2 type transport system ATP-binding protein